jgi:hypothetical protein
LPVRAELIIGELASRAALVEAIDEAARLLVFPLDEEGGGDAGAPVAEATGIRAALVELAGSVEQSIPVRLAAKKVQVRACHTLMMLKVSRCRR